MRTNFTTPTPGAPHFALPGLAPSASTAAPGGRFADELRRQAQARQDADRAPKPGTEPPVAPRERMPDAADRAERRRWLGPPEAGDGDRRDERREAASARQRLDRADQEAPPTEGPRADDPARPGRESPARKALPRRAEHDQTGSPSHPSTPKPGPEQTAALADTPAADAAEADPAALAPAPGSAGPAPPIAPRTTLPKTLPAVPDQPAADASAGATIAPGADAAEGSVALSAIAGVGAGNRAAAATLGAANAPVDHALGKTTAPPAERPGATTSQAAERADPQANLATATALGSASGLAGAAGKPAPLPLPIEQDSANLVAMSQALAAAETAPAPAMPAWATLPAQPHLAPPTAAAPAPVPTHESRLAAPPDSPGFAPALSHQIRLWVQDGVQQAHLQLNPADLGPIQVTIELQGHAASVEFHAAVAGTREALQAALPQLAGELHEAGYTLAGGGVFEGFGRARDGSGGDGREGEPNRGQAGRSQPAGMGLEGIHHAEPPRRVRGLVDLYA